jgi:hypothetical protein
MTPQQGDRTMPAYLHNKDFWAGAMLIAIGALAVFIARDYSFGTMTRMGPGFFPVVLGAVLVLFGIHVFAKGLRGMDKIEAGWSLRAIVMLPLSLALFGFLMDRAGLVPALAVLTFGSAAAGREFKPLEILALTVLLTAFAAGVFVWGLGMPYPLLVGL